MGIPPIRCCKCTDLYGHGRLRYFYCYRDRNNAYSLIGFRHSGHAILKIFRKNFSVRSSLYIPTTNIFINISVLP